MARRSVSNCRDTFVHASQYAKCKRKRTRFPNGRGSSWCCESSRDACWQERRNMRLLARLRTAETRLFEAAAQHHSCPIELNPHVRRRQAQILTQVLGIRTKDF